MRVNPYVSFSGNCAEALAFYEKAFAVKAEIMYYKDAPSESGYQVAPGNESLVMHAQFNFGDFAVMFCDTPPEDPVQVGDNIAISIAFDDADAAKAAFDALKDGGEVGMELQEVFWSKLFGSLTDKFGISWQITL